MEEGLELVRVGLPWRLSLLCQWWWHAQGLSSWVLRSLQCSGVLQEPPFPPEQPLELRQGTTNSVGPAAGAWAGLESLPSLCMWLLSVLPGGGFITRDCFPVTLITSDLYFLGNFSKFWSAELFPTV